jgi:hypothetical protein
LLCRAGVQNVYFCQYEFGCTVKKGDTDMDAATLFKIDEETGRIVDGLSPTFGVSNRAECLTQVLRLAEVASKFVSDNGLLEILLPTGKCQVFNVRN